MTKTTTGILIGYARFSTDRQNLTAQRQELKRLGVAPERLYVDRGLTGTNRERPGLREAMAATRAGDLFIVTRLDRLARSVPDAHAILVELVGRGVRFQFSGTTYDPTDPMSRLMVSMLSTIAQFEADLIRQRTREGMKIAKANGKLRGRQPRLTPRREAHLLALHEAGEHTSSELAELFQVSRATVYRCVQRAKAAQPSIPVGG
jgi:DNA invertase Pin-like site-specific DNA recombinase